VIVAVSDKHLLLLLDNCEHGIDAAHPQSLPAAIVGLATIRAARPRSPIAINSNQTKT
jgi:hypothetical protein